MNSGPRKIVKRVKTGCEICRKRRVKCDEAKPSCRRCVKRKEVCQYLRLKNDVDNKIWKKETVKVPSSSKTGPLDRINIIHPIFIQEEGTSHLADKAKSISKDINQNQNTQPVNFEFKTVVLERYMLDGNDDEAADRNHDNSARPELEEVSKDQSVVHLNSSWSEKSSPQYEPRTIELLDLDATEAGTTEIVDKSVNDGDASALTGETWFYDSFFDMMSISAKSPGSLEESYLTVQSPTTSCLRNSISTSLSLSIDLEVAQNFSDFESLDHYIGSMATSLWTSSRVANILEPFLKESPAFTHAILSTSAFHLSKTFASQKEKQEILLSRAENHYELSKKELGTIMNRSLANTSLQSVSSVLGTLIVLAYHEICFDRPYKAFNFIKRAAYLIGANYSQIRTSGCGQELITAFSRVAVILQSVDKQFNLGIIPALHPELLVQLQSQLQTSSDPTDRLLILMRKVEAVEEMLRFSCTSEEALTFEKHACKIAEELNEWKARLSPDQRPISDVWLDNEPTVQGQLNPIYFESHTAANNYALYLITWLRVRTRYRPHQIRPPDTAAVTKLILRIAAGISPHACQMNTFRIGMEPAVFGAYRWTEDKNLKNWALRYLERFGSPGREGPSNVAQSLKTARFIDALEERRGFLDIRYGRLLMSEDSESWDGVRPYKALFHIRGKDGTWHTEIFTIQ